MKTLSEKLSKLQEQLDLLVSGAAAGISLGQQQHQQHQQEQQEQVHNRDPVTPVSAPMPGEKNTSTSPNRLDTHDDSRAYRRARTRATKHPQYMGPTSSAYSFGLARTSLQDMGIQTGVPLDDNGVTSYSTTPARSPIPSRDPVFPREPLLSITQNEAIRLITIYEEECGTVYPFIDIQLLQSVADKFYRSGISARSPSLAHRLGDENMLSGGIVDILRLVIAIASVFECHGPTSLSARLLNSVESGFEGRLCGPSVDILEIQAWTLMVSSTFPLVSPRCRLTHRRVYSSFTVTRKLALGGPSA